MGKKEIFHHQWWRFNEGPSLIGDGNATLYPTIARDGDGASMGPNLSWRRKPGSGSQMAAMTPQASMGPSLIGDGNLGFSSVGGSCTNALQWGRP